MLLETYLSGDLAPLLTSNGEIAPAATVLASLAEAAPRDVAAASDLIRRMAIPGCVPHALAALVVCAHGGADEAWIRSSLDRIAQAGGDALPAPVACDDDGNDPVDRILHAILEIVPLPPEETDLCRVVCVDARFQSCAPDGIALMLRFPERRRIAAPSPITGRMLGDPDPELEAEPIAASAELEAEPIAATAEPEAEPIAATAEPEAEPIAATAEPETEPVAATAEPETEPVTATAELEAEPIAATAEPEAEPIAATAEPETEPIAATAEPETEPVAATAGPEAEPVAATAEPETEPVAATAGPEAEPVAATAEPETEPVAATAEPEAEPVAATAEPEAGALEDPYALDECAPDERRKSPRRSQHLVATFRFTGPGSNASTAPIFRGELFDLSGAGAGIRIDNRNGRFDPATATGRTALLEVPSPNGGGPIALEGIVRWCTAEQSSRRQIVRVGLEYAAPGSGEAQAMGEIAAQGKGDQQFLWNLWEAYEQTRSRDRMAS